MADSPRYRFGPLEKRGVLGGLQASQLAILAATGITIVILARVLDPSATAVSTLVLCTVAAFAAFVPLGGRTLSDWLPVLASWGVAGVLGRRRFVSPAPTRGATRVLDPQPMFPAPMRGLTILAHRVPGYDGSVGLIKDEREGTFTGVLSVRGRSFALLDPPDKARRLSDWAGILSGLARERGVVHRIQWVERTVPDPGDEVGNYLKENLAVPIDSLIARSYLEVVDEAGPVTQQHESFVALQIHAARSARAIKTAGGGDGAACELLCRELTSLAAKLMSADVVVQGALTPRLLASALRSGFDPFCRDRLAYVAARAPERDGTSIGNAAPIAADSMWSSYQTDGAWHRTYWIAEWPRVDADPDFLAPLLLRTERMRTVSLTMEPISPLKAIRTVESARTSAAADEELRQRAGFATTARRSREHEALADHERDLGHGHAFYRFSGFVTVTAPDPQELERSCGEIEEAAARSFLDVRCLFGEQDRAFTYTLPLCRGLR